MKPVPPATRKAMAVAWLVYAAELEASHWDPCEDRVPERTIRLEIERYRRWARLLKGSD